MEIKFRAWDSKIKTFLTWSFPENRFQNVFWNICHNENLIPEQYTNLKDKNGIEIFVGDVLSVYNRNINEYVGYEVIFTESFNLGLAFVGRYYSKEYKVFHYTKLYENLEIIGNIHQNQTK